MQSALPTNSAVNYNFYYYEQYKKLYAASFMLSTQLRQLLKTKQQLIQKLDRIQKKADDTLEQMRNSNTEDKKKRVRRPAVLIPRHYQCPVSKCQKLYGSEGSLNQHIRLKHPQQVDLSRNEEQYQDENSQKDI